MSSNKIYLKKIKKRIDYTIDQVFPIENISHLTQSIKSKQNQSTANQINRHEFQSTLNNIVHYHTQSIKSKVSQSSPIKTSIKQHQSNVNKIKQYQYKSNNTNQIQHQPTSIQFKQQINH